MKNSKKANKPIFYSQGDPIVYECESIYSQKKKKKTWKDITQGCLSSANWL